MANQITTLPTPPTRQSPATFAAHADTFLGALPTFVTEANALATEAETNASTAEAQATLATGAAQDAMAFASVGNAAKWVSGATYAIGDVAWSPVSYLTYRRKTAGAGTTDPSTDTSNWAFAGGNTNTTRSARTSNTALGQSDRGRLIDVTSGTFTQTFISASVLRDGWWCYIRNNGTGDITLDPSGSETIDGLTSFIMYPGETRLIQCDGTGFHSMVLKSFYRVFATTSTFVEPPGYSRLGIEMWGGGASGSKRSAGTASEGGGGGACSKFEYASSSGGTSHTITIGAGATPVTIGGTGNLGGSSSVFGVSALGGGVATYNYAGGGAYGATFANDAISSSGYGGFMSGGNGYSGSVGATPSIYGGGGGGGITAGGETMAASSSVFAGNGGAASSASNGTDGTIPGGGGGATISGTQSGAGARGECRIWGIL